MASSGKEKFDLNNLPIEFGLHIDDGLKVTKINDLILKCPHYNEQFVKSLRERKELEKMQLEENKGNEERDFEEKKRKEERKCGKYKRKEDKQFEKK